jgi:SecY
MNRLISTIKNIFAIDELRSRILNTLLFITAFRLGTHIVLPGVNPNKMNMTPQGLLGLLDTFLGGAFSRASIFALGIMPYISASIAIQLLTLALPYFQKMQKGRIGPETAESDHPCADHRCDGSTGRDLPADNGSCRSSTRRSDVLCYLIHVYPDRWHYILYVAWRTDHR